jgi:spore germination cell wall hydrolase CwlJ-like protein
MPDHAELDCLALNIYHESKGEPHLGQIGVAAVTMNRVFSGRFANGICKVVKQKYQFSWVHLKKDHSARGKAWEQSREVAYKYLNGSYEDPTKGALYFHAKHVNPNWNFKRKAVIGGHIFY